MPNRLFPYQFLLRIVVQTKKISLNWDFFYLKVDKGDNMLYNISKR